MEYTIEEITNRFGKTCIVNWELYKKNMTKEWDYNGHGDSLDEGDEGVWYSNFYNFDSFGEIVEMESYKIFAKTETEAEEIYYQMLEVFHETYNIKLEALKIVGPKVDDKTKQFYFSTKMLIADLTEYDCYVFFDEVNNIRKK